MISDSLKIKIINDNPKMRSKWNHTSVTKEMKRIILKEFDFENSDSNSELKQIEKFEEKVDEIRKKLKK